MAPVALEDVSRVARAASEALAPAERASAVLEALRAVVPFDHAEIAAVDPFDGSRRLLANVGYSDDMLDHFHGPEFDEEIRSLDMHETGYPVRMRDVPGDALAVRTIAEKLVPAGYTEGMTMCLRTESGRETGLLNLSTSDARHPSDAERDAVSALCPTLANVADATQSARFLVSLLEPGAFAIALSRDGAVTPLDGISTHPLLSADAQLPRLAHAIIGRDGRRSTRFLWPAGDRCWHRVGVTPCQSDGPGGCDAIVTVQAETIVIELTRRELEVLTMLTSGWSNAEIGSRLWISPRTVGTYVEGILAKLSVPTRAAAAARAVVEGLIVPLEALADESSARSAAERRRATT
jgi:DNA-binding CsgD family transcriptional regulator